MKKILLFLAMALPLMAAAQTLPEEYEGQSCTSIMVGKRATIDGSVITSHTCDGRYRTWMNIVPAADYRQGAVHEVRKGTMHTMSKDDTAGVNLVGTIPEAPHTYAYLNTAYPCLNEKQLAIGESTFGGPEVLQNKNAMFDIEELQRIALQRCATAREAIRLIGELIALYGYSDGGECLTIADKREVWQMEIIGEGFDKIGGCWAAQRVPDDHVAVSANIPRIGKLQRDNPDYFMCSDNIEEVAMKNYLWDGIGEFSFWKAFCPAYANGKNFREREFFIFNSLAPSQGFTMEMKELPFSVKPDNKVDVTDVMSLLRSTYEGTDMDMCRNLRVIVPRKRADGSSFNDTVVSPGANPWLTRNNIETFNLLAPGSVKSVRTVSVAWCSYSFVTQLRSWLPDAVGGVCWMAFDNPGQSPRIPIFCGTTELPDAFGLCGQKEFNEDAILWKFRKANKLATVAWHSTRKMHMNIVKYEEGAAMGGMTRLEESVKQAKNTRAAAKLLNEYTKSIYENTTYAWRKLEAKYWQMFGMGF
jgi:dipeptidase